MCIHSVLLSPCDIFVDTMGVGFSYPFVKILFGVQVYSYTHYPFISRDMINTVTSGKEQYNNQNAGSAVKRNVKFVYYWVVYQAYKVCGYFADEVAANSSWTRGHMDELWNKGSRIKTIYPPCDTSDFIKRISLTAERRNMMISFAQFRPEKQHELQLRIWSKILEDPRVPRDAMFHLIGTCRGPDDEQIVKDLRKQAVQLGIENRIRFEINVDRDKLYDLFQNAKVAIHTMEFEHFGIAIVELMSSGIITVAHNSAGPKSDIIGPSKEPVGYLGSTLDHYVDFAKKALLEYDDGHFHTAMRVNARKWVKDQFGIEAFNHAFLAQIENLVR